MSAHAHVAAPEHRTAPRDWLATQKDLVAAAGASAALTAFVLAGAITRYAHYGDTFDYALYAQAWYLIAHGHLDPRTTIGHGYFYQNHFELIIWPAALLWFLWPHSLDLLVVQALATGATVFVAYRWGREVLATTVEGLWRPRLRALLLVLLVGTPWWYGANLWDFHWQAVAACAVVSAGYGLWRGRWGSAFGWAVVTLLCGDVTSTYVAGLGIAALAFSRAAPARTQSIRWAAMSLIVMGGGWLLFIHALGADHGSGLGSTYGYLAGLPPSTSLGVPGVIRAVLTHPQKAFGVLWSRRTDLWANIAPAGALGMLEPLFAPVAWVVIAAPALARYPGFLTPAGFQNLPAWPFIALGSVTVLGRMVHRPHGHRWVAPLALAMAASTGVWAATWYVAQPALFAMPSTAAAALLRQIRADLAPGTEVIASQGVVGRFAERLHAYPIMGPGRLVLRPGTVVVVTPDAGIETASLNEQVATLATLARAPHVHPLLWGHGVWAFRYDGTRSLALTLARPAPQVAGWALPSATGTPQLAGPPGRWYLAGGQRAGYVVYGSYWREPMGRYVASVRLSNTVPVAVEVWNTTGNVLLARRILPPNAGVATVRWTVSNPKRYPHRGVYLGWGVVQVQPVTPPRDDQLEIRVWSPGGGAVNVYTVGLAPAP